MTQVEKSLSFDFMGVGVLVKSNSPELLSRLSRDFSHFLTSSANNPTFVFNSSLEEEISIEIPPWPLVRRSKSSLSYERGDIRFNDYYGKLVSIYNYKTEEGELCSYSLEKLHEITYLIILSRVGKYFDLKGLHKIHAMGIVYKDVCAIGMMDMGVGKSTLLLELLKDKGVTLLSDDTPLVTSEGEVKKFPLRIGIEILPEDLVVSDENENLYSLERELYGKKNLICLEGLENNIDDTYKSLVFFEGLRGHGRASGLIKSNKLSMWLALQKHMVVGIGLPMIFEYFWESGPIDFYRKTKIFFLRQLAAFRLLSKCSYYKFYMSEDPGENARVLKESMID